ncbi:hypothetical protein WKV44_00185 [Spirochaetia bacterium 38H-sp]|uniref:Uncharacterized protein n=1 Tax=Rarispira pelagica TaxID=3141764 RepID=A0ABU9U8G5_9SPIR
MKTTKRNKKVISLLLLVVVLPLALIACANPVTADIERVATNATTSTSTDSTASQNSGDSPSDTVTVSDVVSDSASVATVVDITDVLADNDSVDVAYDSLPVSETVDSTSVENDVALGSATDVLSSSETVVDAFVPVVTSTNKASWLVDTLSGIITSSNLSNVSLDGNILVISTSKGSYQLKIKNNKANVLIKEIRKVVKQEKKDKELRKVGSQLIKELRKEIKKNKETRVKNSKNTRENNK